jgi:phosphatidylinositol alpha-mannosyltransferase
MAGEPLKIGLVLDDSLDKTDGVQQYVLALGGWLETQGHEVHYLVGETRRVDIPRVHSLAKNLAVRFNGNRMSMPLPGASKRIKRLLSEEGFDVLHVQLPYSPFLGGRIIAHASPTTAIVGTFHILPNSLLSVLANRVLAAWCRAGIKRFEKIVSVSAAAQRFARRVYGITGDVLENMVDYQRFYGAKPLARYHDNKKTVLFLGRLVPRKGCGLLLEAVKLLADSEAGLPEFRVVICGTGPLESSLKQYVAENKLQDYVEFAGYVPEADKPRYYASADIAVFPSNGGESFGIVLLEAMASGRTAVLAGNNPGYASVLADRTDLLFDPHDAGALAGELQLLLSNDEERQSIVRWCAAYARQFDTPAVGKRLLELYRDALRLRRNMR